VAEVSSIYPANQQPAKFIVLSALALQQVPNAADWCDALNASPKEWPGVPSNTVFALNAQAAGYALASFGATPLLIEAAAVIPVPEILRGAFEYVNRQTADSHKLMLFLPVLVVAPVAEELFFRGLVLHGYARRYGLTKAVWGSAVLFAAFHLNPWQAVLALPLGLALA
jgi:membrane protease YdiL (CAAX protease family)